MLILDVNILNPFPTESQRFLSRVEVSDTARVMSGHYGTVSDTTYACPAKLALLRLKHQVKRKKKSTSTDFNSDKAYVHCMSDELYSANIS